MEISNTSVGNVLTRTSGYLRTITSHSLQPYRGCPLGNSLCGVGCYVQHNPYVTQGRRWGSFLEVRTNAADSYRATAAREARWARRHREGFSIFLSSSTEPFPPQEKRYGITRQVLEAMVEQPPEEVPDELILQTHSPRVTEVAELLRALARRCRLRVHLSIETDRPKLPGLPPPASTIAQRFAAAAQLKEAGLATVITVAPLLPLEDPESFFSRVAEAADAVVLDHFIGGDGSSTGSRTRRTRLPAAMEEVQPASSELGYRDAMVRIAQRHLPGKVGVGIDGFAGRFLA
ncbi:MAG: hypothetical protein K0U98_01850 [Deltaproteobacteria bacterium]|nr:hypothetical protein [Deltaproteobacteria bacterium]